MWAIRNGKAYDMGFGESYEFEDGDDVLPKELLERIHALPPLTMKVVATEQYWKDWRAIRKEIEALEVEHNTTVLFGSPTDEDDGEFGITP